MKLLLLLSQILLFYVNINLSCANKEKKNVKQISFLEVDFFIIYINYNIFVIMNIFMLSVELSLTGISKFQ